MMQIVLDFDTYYDRDYSLRKMTPVEYILDPRFECIGCAVSENGDKAVFYDALNFQRYLRTRDLTKCVVLSHNALFDMCLLAWRFFVVPGIMIDTMAMARALVFHKTGRVSLSEVAKHLRLNDKGGTIHKVVGMNAAQIRAAGLWDEYAQYACNDAELCWQIYLTLRGKFPVNEIAINDMVIRCAVEPQMLTDTTRLAEHLDFVKRTKAETLTKSMLYGLDSKEQLMSNDQFAELLRKLGVEPGIKISKTTGKPAYAFAKTDDFMMQLVEHRDVRVQTIAAARVGHKTTLEETRTEKFMRIGHLTWPQHLGRPKYRQGLMPIPLRFSGAHTHRLSGDWGMNLQNMPRPKKGDPASGALRRSLVAPEGHKVMTVDSSQIEARVVACLCGQDDLVAAFDRGEDIYSSFASDVYQRPINKIDDPNERFVGKQAILGLGFGMGDARFYTQIISDSFKQGLDVEITPAMAVAVVNLYRRKFPKIPQGWKALASSLPMIAAGTAQGSFGPLVLGNQQIYLPGYMPIHYTDLRHEEGGWRYTYGKETKYLFGGKVMENCVQYLARIVVMDAAVEIKKRVKRLGLQLAMQCHDELVYVVPDDLIEVVRKILVDEMTRRPKFMPNLPLACEVGVGQTYGDAK